MIKFYVINFYHYKFYINIKFYKYKIYSMKMINEIDKQSLTGRGQRQVVDPNYGGPLTPYFLAINFYNHKILCV